MVRIPGKATLKRWVGLGSSTSAKDDVSNITPQAAAAQHSQKIFDPELAFHFKPILYSVLLRTDAELHAGINNISFMCRNAYDGFYIEPDDKNDDSKEKELRKVLKNYENGWNVKQMFFDVPYSLMTYGNAIGLKRPPVIDDSQTGHIEWMPITHTTIHESKQTIGAIGGGFNDMSGAQVFDANYYVLNERPFFQGAFRNRGTFRINGVQKVIKERNIIHFNINSEMRPTIDVGDRYTYGVWGVSPIEPLTQMLIWKQNIIITDTAFRSKVPRIHHKLDSMPFDHSNYRDAKGDKREAADTGAKTALGNYVNQLEYLQRGDQDIVTLDNVAIDYVESKTSGYMQPNALIDQIINSQMAVLGIPKAALTGETDGSFAAELITTNYAVMRAKNLTDTIACQLIEVIKRDIQTKMPGKFSDDLLNRITIRMDYVMQKDVDTAASTAVKQYSMVDSEGFCIFTEDELRETAGFAPRTESQKKNKFRVEDPDKKMENALMGKGQGVQKSGTDQSAAKKTSGGGQSPKTPESTNKRQT